VQFVPAEALNGKKCDVDVKCLEVGIGIVDEYHALEAYFNDIGGVPRGCESVKMQDDKPRRRPIILIH